MSKKVYSVYTTAPEKPQGGLFGTEDKIVFREEQVKAITDARKHFEKKEDMQQYLWNAKMRFGKTLCALELARQMSETQKKNRRVKRVLIVTHRPVVNESWKEDFEKIFGKNPARFKYGTKFENDFTGNFFDLERHATAAEENGYVFFASMQYLRRSNLVNDNEKPETDPENERLRNAILENDWDLVVIDEAHEGTRTSLGFRVIAVLKKEKTKLLHLSGTPFNLYEDFGDDEIYNWDYVKEQQAKADWEKKHPGEYNPYAVLPHMNIFTYDLAKLVKGKDFSENDSFKFKEFFRTWTGNPKTDGAEMPQGKKGRFVHEQEVNDFLDLMCKEDEESNYPFSKELYQDNFNHTLWIVPGVKEAKALTQLLKEHDIFRNFEIVNVAGNSDDDETNENALDKVHKAIGKRPAETATITISCGRLTTGVTVPQWTAVMYLKGSDNTSAATYMQTIFRVQSTDTTTYPGKMKAECYVFDFAPDRSLKMVAETAKFANLTSKEKRSANTSSKEDDIATMKEFMNFFAVVSLEGGQMRPYDAEKLFEQLDSVYIDRIVRNGFNDNMIYNTSYLMHLDEAQLNRLNELGGIIEKTTNMEKPKKAKEIKLADNDLKDKAKKAKLKQKEGKPLTPEEKATIEAEKAARAKEREERENRISILRGIALRIPLLIYGAKLIGEEDPKTEEAITIDNLTERIDDSSWEEFMPRGITKEIFEEIKPCFNAKMFALAGKRYRQLAREADTMHTNERVKRIAEIFSYFHNPDKETVLTPWRVVNMHMSDTLGGYCFFNEKFDGPNQKIVDGTAEQLFDYIDTTEPRFVDRGNVTKEVFNTSSKILEINSKTGLYPLYVTYSIYRQRMKDFAENGLIADVENYSVSEEQVIWDDIVKNNIFVICNTPMAARITERTLLGFRPITEENIKEDKLIEQAISNREELIEKLQTVGYWKGTTDNTEMKFNAIVGNPPYQVMDGGAGASATPVYNLFVDIARKLNPKYLSMIMPSRWYSGGKGLDDFRDSMLSDVHIRQLDDFLYPDIVFPGTNIRGGLCFFLWDSSYNNTISQTRVITHGQSGVQNSVMRPLRIPEVDTFIRSVEAISIIKKVKGKEFESISKHISSRKPFGLPTDYTKSTNYKSTPDVLLHPILCYGKGMCKGYVERDTIKVHPDWIDRWKVLIPRANNIGTELNDDNLNTFLCAPGEITTESYLVVGAELNLTQQECINLMEFLSTKFARFMHSIAKSSQDATQKTFVFVPLQDFSKSWTDAELYAKYKLDKHEIEFIEKMIKPME